jgi:hypothetical protein
MLTYSKACPAGWVGCTVLSARTACSSAASLPSALVSDPEGSASPLVALVSDSEGSASPAGLVKQVPHGDAGRGDRVGQAEPGQVALHRRVQVDLARLDQLHDRQGGQRLGRRGQQEGGLRGDRPAGRAGLAEAAQVHHLVAVDDAERQAGQAGGAPLRLHVAVDGGKIRRAGARCAGRGRDRWAHRAKREQGEQGSQHRDGGPPHCAGPQPRIEMLLREMLVFTVCSLPWPSRRRRRCSRWGSWPRR